MEDVFFIASKLFWFVAQPGNLLAFLVIFCASFGIVRSRSRWLSRANVILLGFTASLTFLPIGDWIESPLEQRFQPALLQENSQRPAGVIVLGGVIDPIATTTSGMPSVGGGAERVLEMLYLARLYPDTPVIYTGGSGRLTDTEHREADAARLLIERIGLDSTRFVFESSARNTFENATRVAELYPPKPEDNWILVTSAAHMPRSVGVFRRVGFKVIPYPVDYKSKYGKGFSFRFDLAGGLSGVSSALKEWIGLLVYRLMGRTNELFPSP
mgnify:FL=1|tara:strand:- start:3276 stop:4085 length:810 start_codon:yes stop_codon:yes gene_type:complete